MSSPAPPLAKYHFYPVARRGAVVALPASAADPLSGPLTLRPSLVTRLSVTARHLDGSTTAITDGPPAGLQIYGPGDVIGFDKRHIVRTEPADGTVNFESNYFAAIEFDYPDLPWMFTPAASAANGTKLRPWIFLLVLEDGEYKLTPPGQAGGMATITVNNDPKLLPNLGESWLWAHVQLTADPESSLDKLLTEQPHRFVSRIICPRRLKPRTPDEQGTSYTAFLVPTFKAGCDAVLSPGPPASGSSVPTTTDVAWNTANAAVQQVTLPAYFSFSFRTAPAGDFESLALRLKPQPLTEVGQRPLAVDDPRNAQAWHLDPITSGGKALHIGGALQQPLPSPPPPPNQPPPDEWSAADKKRFQPPLALMLNLATPVTEKSSDPDPIVVPPIYGRYHAGVDKVDPNAPGWVNELNLDPRLRAAAGLGARVVTEERSQLMASAWRQIDGVQRANQILRHAQLSRASLQQTYQNTFQPATPEAALTMTANVHSRIMTAGRTVSAHVAESAVPVRALQPTIRRLTRPRGPWAQRQGISRATFNGFIQAINNAKVVIAPPAGAPHGAAVMPAAPAAAAPRAGSPATPTATASSAELGGLDFLKKSLGTPARPAFIPATPGDKSRGEGDAGSDSSFRTGLQGISDLVQHASNPPAPRPSIDLGQKSAAVIAALNPKVTVERRTASLVTVAAHLNWRPKDPLEPIMAAPVFPQPMYAPLRDISQEFLLPGVGKIPRDAVGLLAPNQKFIEAYMAALNFEMARQLLWNRYPTDQRGSYFRQFWDVSGYIELPGDPPPDSEELREKLRDIPPIHLWDTRSALGTHPNPKNPDAAGALVLVVRGELLRRYPTTDIYAIPAVPDPAGGARSKGGPKLVPSDDTTLEIHPLFRGTLTPDLTYIGLSLTEQEALTGGKPGHGYFFVLQQHPTEPRFGLEDGPPTDDTGPVTWAYFGGSDALFATVNAKTAVSGHPLVSNWGTDSANAAQITFRRPTRIAIYADLMLPKST